MTTIAPTVSTVSLDYKLMQSKETVPTTTGIGQVIPIEFNKDNAIEDCDFKGFICPLSLEKFVNPVVDKCGHTFEKVAIRAYCKAVSKDDIHFPCPLNRTAILDINQLVTNYALKSAIEETENVLEENAKNLPRISVFENKMIEQNEKIIKQNEEIKQQNEKITKLTADLVTANAEIEAERAKRKIMKKQMENVQNMSFGGRLLYLLSPSYLETVKNRDTDSLKKQG